MLSTAQTRLYILQQMDEENSAYNLPTSMTLEGKVNSNQLQMVFRELIHQHESLRTSFHIRENQPVQKVHDEVEFEIEYYQVEAEVKVEEEEDPNEQIQNKKETQGHHS